MSDIVEYKTIEEVIDAFSARSRSICKDMLEYAWDLGKVIKEITEEAAYGEGALQQVVEKLGLSKSTLYAYRQFNNTYEDKQMVLSRFGENDIPFRTLYKILSLPDDIRAVVEEKLISGELPEESLDAFKQKLREEEEAAKLLEENQSVEGQQAEAEAPSEDVTYSKKVKAPLYKVDKLCEKMEQAFHDAEASFQHMDMISDQNLYDSVTSVMDSSLDKLRAMFEVAEHFKDRIKGYSPDPEPEANAEGKK